MIEGTLFETLVHIVQASAFTYAVLANLVELLLLVFASRSAVNTWRMRHYRGTHRAFDNPLLPGVSIILPAHNEEAVVLQSVRSMLNMRYPSVEVVVVDDGSTDQTFERLRKAFDLVPLHRPVPDFVPVAGQVIDTYVPRGKAPLIVVRKESAGTKADATNCGINLATKALVCVTDGDTLLKPSSVLHLAAQFLKDPNRLVALGGSVRVVNECVVRRGMVAGVRYPKKFLTRIQVLEYTRAFTIGRTGWSRLGALMIISGAFGLFRRDALIRVGGFRHGSLAEDAQLVLGLHRTLRERRVRYRIAFDPETEAWTEVPENVGVLRRQRVRWSAGMVELMTSNRDMLFRGRYGRIGTLTMPYFLVFEMLQPFVFFAGVTAVILGATTGINSTESLLILVLGPYGLAVMGGTTALLLDEIALSPYRGMWCLFQQLSTIWLEPLLFAPLHATWRLEGNIRALRGSKIEWGVMTRTGFGDDDHDS